MNRYPCQPEGQFIEAASIAAKVFSFGLDNMATSALSYAFFSAGSFENNPIVNSPFRFILTRPHRLHQTEDL